MTAGRSRRRWLAAAVAAVGLAAITVAQCVPNRHSMEDDLTRRSVAALRAANLADVKVSFTGRDGTIWVTSAAETERALAVVRAQEGVRVAEAVVPATAPTTLPAVRLAVDAGHVTLTGAVPSGAARSALIGAATTTFGAGAVQDQLTIDPGTSEVGLAGLGGILSTLGLDAKGAVVDLRGGVITLTGTLSSATAKDAVVAAAVQAIGSSSAVIDRLQVVVPTPTPTPTSKVQTALTKLPNVTFHTGSANLTDQGKKVVAQVAQILAANPGIRIRIEGHTDTNGTSAANLTLSRARANSVMAALRAHGIAANRMTAVGYGESRLKVPDTSPTNQAINRRVEFIVLS